MKLADLESKEKELKEKKQIFDEKGTDNEGANEELGNVVDGEECVYDTRVEENEGQTNSFDFEIKDGLRLAVEARTLGSKGAKSGADMGAVIMKDGAVVSWGCARSLLPLSETEPRMKKCIKTDLHAEQDAITFAAKKGISLEGCKLFVSGPPCMTCFPIIVAAGITQIFFVGSMEQVYKPDTCSRMRNIATQHHVEIFDKLSMPDYIEIDMSNRTLFRDDLDI